MFNDGLRCTQIQAVSGKTMNGLLEKLSNLYKVYGGWNWKYDEPPHKVSENMFKTTIRFFKA